MYVDKSLIDEILRDIGLEHIDDYQEREQE
jgi:hypothetical protein